MSFDRAFKESAGKEPQRNVNIKMIKWNWQKNSISYRFQREAHKLLQQKFLREGYLRTLLWSIYSYNSKRFGLLILMLFVWCTRPIAIIASCQILLVINMKYYSVPFNPLCLKFHFFYINESAFFLLQFACNNFMGTSISILFSICSIAPIQIPYTWLCSWCDCFQPIQIISIS